MTKKKKGSNKIVWILLVLVVLVLVFAIVGKQAGVIGGAKTIKVEFAEASRVTIV